MVPLPTSFARREDSRGRRVDPEAAELAVQGRAADSEAPRDLAHPAAVMADRQANDVGFDFLQRTEVSVGGVERDSGSAGDRFVAARLAELRQEIGLAVGEAGLDRDVREMLGGERSSIALQRGSKEHAGELAHVAWP